MKWYDAPIVVMDFETTGFNKPHIIEIGAVLYEKGVETARLDLRVKPDKAIDPGALAIHGIRIEDLTGEPPFAERYEELHNFLKERVPASYGAFDRRVLHGELNRMRDVGFNVDEQIPAFSGTWGVWLDLLGWARKLHKGRGRGKHTLGAMTEKYGIDLLKAHSAIDDAEAAGKLLWSWREQLPDTTLSKLLSTRLPNR